MAGASADVSGLSRGELGTKPFDDKERIFYSRTPGDGVSTASNSAWDAPVNTGFDYVVYKLQDKSIDLKRVVESISKSVGAISDSSSVPQSVAKWLPDTVMADEMKKRIGDFAQQPPIRIRDTAFGQLPCVARDNNVAGVVHDGTTYLFRDQLRDRTAVQRTLFHELFNFGFASF